MKYKFQDLLDHCICTIIKIFEELIFEAGVKSTKPAKLVVLENLPLHGMYKHHM